MQKHTFPSRRPDGNTVSGLEKLSLGDGVVHLCFEDPEEAVLAYLLPCLWTPQNRLRVLAEGTALRCHPQQQLRAEGDRWTKRAGGYRTSILRSVPI